jgi:hypothetical protein
MMRKSIVLLLVVLLAVALSSSVTVADEKQPVYILAYYEGHYDVDLSEQVPVVVNNWVACSKGLVKTFVKAIDRHEYSLTGPGPDFFLGTEEAQELWGPVEEYPDPEFECFAPGLSPKVTYWWYVPDLEPGDYELHSTESLAHPVIDGFDAYPEDGLPDLYGGELFSTVNTIHVVE